VDGSVETEPGECFCLTLARTEAGTPKQSLGMSGVERTFECGNSGHWHSLSCMVAQSERNRDPSKGATV
jgi:hypothetical protein